MIRAIAFWTKNLYNAAGRQDRSLKTSAAPRASYNGWERVQTVPVPPLKTGYFTVHFTYS